MLIAMPGKQQAHINICIYTKHIRTFMQNIMWERMRDWIFGSTTVAVYRKNICLQIRQAICEQFDQIDSS